MHIKHWEVFACHFSTFGMDGMSSVLYKKIFMLIKQYYWYFMFFIKFNYLIGTNILQIVFDFITYSVAI